MSCLVYTSIYCITLLEVRAALLANGMIIRSFSLRLDLADRKQRLLTLFVAID